MAATVAGILLTGNHASRPSSGVSVGTLYSCTDHSLIYQTSDTGSTWGTWASLAGTGIAATTLNAKGDILGASANDTPAVTTVGANDTILMADSGQSAGLKWVAAATPSTQAFGDAAAEGTADTFTRGDHKHAMPLVPGWVTNQVGVTDSTHFYWDGNDLASFTEVDVTGTTTWSEGKNQASVVAASQSTDDISVILIAQTINTGDAWKTCVKGIMGHTDTGNASFAGIVMTDGTTSTSNAIMGHVQCAEAANVYTQLLVGRSGTLTAMNTAPWVLDDDQPMPASEIWIKLTYVSSNTFRVAFSPDDVTYHSFGEADISKTMTPSHVGLAVSCFEADGNIITFGPLLKV